MITDLELLEIAHRHGIACRTARVLWEQTLYDPSSGKAVLNLRPSNAAALHFTWADSTEAIIVVPVQFVEVDEEERERDFVWSKFLERVEAGRRPMQRCKACEDGGSRHADFCPDS